MSVFRSRNCLILSIFALSLLVAACGQPSSTPDSSVVPVEENVASEPTVQPAIRSTPATAPTAPAQENVAVEPTARPAIRDIPATVPAVKRPEPRFVQVDLPAGTELELELLDTLSSGTSQAGDPVRARLVGALFAEGRRVAPAGAEVLGTVTEVVPLKKFGGQPRISLVFESLAVANGGSVPVLASHVQAGKKQAGRDAAKIGGAAAAGAVIGHQVDDDKGTQIGALLGGMIGTAVAAKTGKEVELTAGTTIVVVLESDVRVRLGS